MPRSCEGAGRKSPMANELEIRSHAYSIVTSCNVKYYKIIFFGV